jgi:hypothetical protein
MQSSVLPEANGIVASGDRRHSATSNSVPESPVTAFGQGTNSLVEHRRRESFVGFGGGGGEDGAFEVDGLEAVERSGTGSVTDSTHHDSPDAADKKRDRVSNACSRCRLKKAKVRDLITCFLRYCTTLFCLYRLYWSGLNERPACLLTLEHV